MVVPAAKDLRLRALVQAADQAAAEGRLDDGARLWEQVLALEPENPKALFRLGQHTLFRKDARGALEMLRRAAIGAPGDPLVQLNIAYASRSLGDQDAELRAIESALAIDPYLYPALLLKAALFEKIGRPRQAARIYKDVLTIAPPENAQPPEMKAQLAQARLRVSRNAEELDDFLQPLLQDLRGGVDAAHLERFEACKDILLGTKRLYTQQPTMLHYPGLPAIQFYDTSEFPWIADIEAASGAIREELFSLVAEDTPGFRPYVDHPAGVPLNQWQDLNHSPRWSAYFLWENGVRIEDHCRRCPRTAEAAEAAPLCHIPGFAPAVFFSTLEPGTRIPAHTGVTNARLILHLPLVVPEACGFRVGNDTRAWKPGQAWIFDDTIEHEAWNESDRLRVLLIIDIWNPYLSIAERQLVTALLNGVRSYYGN